MWKFFVGILVAIGIYNVLNEVASHGQDIAISWMVTILSIVAWFSACIIALFVYAGITSLRKKIFPKAKDLSKTKKLDHFYIVISFIISFIITAILFGPSINNLDNSHSDEYKNRICFEDNYGGQKCYY